MKVERGLARESIAVDNAWVAQMVRSECDVVLVRHVIRRLAAEQGFSRGRTEALATAATEVAQNVVFHAEDGIVTVGACRERGRRGVVVVVRDTGPGIVDLSLALEDGYSSAFGLGLGLPSAQRLVDDFVVESWPGRGTHVLLRSWRKCEP